MKVTGLTSENVDKYAMSAKGCPSVHSSQSNTATTRGYTYTYQQVVYILYSSKWEIKHVAGNVHILYLYAYVPLLGER